MWEVYIDKEILKQCVDIPPIAKLFTVSVESMELVVCLPCNLPYSIFLHHLKTTKRFSECSRHK